MATKLIKVCIFKPFLENTCHIAVQPINEKDPLGQK